MRNRGFGDRRFRHRAEQPRDFRIAAFRGKVARVFIVVGRVARLRAFGEEQANGACGQ